MSETPASNDSVMIVERSVLNGTIACSGAKNSALRLMAASLLTGEDITLTNFPSSLKDVEVHAGMLEALGKSVTLTQDTCVIKEVSTPPSKLIWPGRSIRNTLLILGALTARTGAGAVPVPGGCQLGERKYDLHIMLLERLGARVFEDSDGHLAAEAPNGLIGNDIYLPIRSTGATENALIAGSLAKGTTTIWNPHIAPEILDLVAFLRSLGAEIEVDSQDRIIVQGQARLSGTQHRVVSDRIEAVTWLIAAVATGGELVVENFPVGDLEVPMIFLRESGTEMKVDGTTVTVKGKPSTFDIVAGPYPHIHSDMQPMYCVYGLAANGVSKIADLRHKDRFGYVAELNKMGAKTELDGVFLTIHGGVPLHGAEVKAVDLRAGITLILAGMIADGQTVISDAWQAERGYDRLLPKLTQIGANLRRG